MTGKLVRDKVPEIIKKSGRNPDFKKLKPSEFRRQLFRKLGEEIREFRGAKTTKDKTEEMADIFEVLRGLCDINNINIDEVVETGKTKRVEKGGFEQMLYLNTK